MTTSPRDLSDPRARATVLAQHSFVSEQYQPNRIGLFVGNGELGGPARPDGLGFDKLYVASLWHTSCARGFLSGPRLLPPEELSAEARYRQRLELQTGILQTSYADAREVNYETILFGSQAEKSLLRMSLTNKTTRAQTWRLALPTTLDATWHCVSDQVVHIASSASAQTRWACAISSTVPLRPVTPNQKQPTATRSAGVLQFSLLANERIDIAIALTTHWEGGVFAERAYGIAFEAQDAPELSARAHVAAMKKLWDTSGWVSLPDQALERLFYRCAYWLFAGSGSRYALPQETALASVDAWSGVAFTYGFGWAILAFTALGHPCLARRIARLMHLPGGQARNAQFLLERLRSGDTRVFMSMPGDPPAEGCEMPAYEWSHFATEGHHKLRVSHPTARSFGHQVSIYGDDRMRRGHQRHIDGFIAAAVYRLAEYNNEEAFLLTTAYPILRGTASFWCELLEWSDEYGGYVTPVLHSVSENLDARSVTDAVLSAKWNLWAATALAERLQLDEAARECWRERFEKIIVPKHHGRFVEYLGQTEPRQGSGYFGIRFPIYLGYPGWELARFIDPAAAHQSFAATRESNRDNTGMISFIASAFAASASTYGESKEWLHSIRRNLELLDAESGALFEVEGKNAYFHTSHAAYVCAIVSALLQSEEGATRLFHAIPSSWDGVEFYNLPAHGGRRISARWRQGRIEAVRIDGIEVPPEQLQGGMTSL